MNGGNKHQPVPEWQEENSIRKGKEQPVICHQTHLEWVCIDASGTGSYVFINDVSADTQAAGGWIRKYRFLYQLLRFSFKPHGTPLHIADGQWPEADFECKPRFLFLKEKW